MNSNNTELSTDLITHKLKIKGEGTKYISKNFAKNVFAQLSDPTKKTIVIANPKNLTHITKYKSEIDLIPLDGENKDFEDTLYMSNLSESNKDRVRGIWDVRKKEKKSRSQTVLKEIINSLTTYEK